ncbi:hypothetical protein RE070_004434 [Klebsiella aerogenes]|nr:hypothetical protein [Klebsiella aerogenes]ELA2606829.1 hypothetical protein [Klebsiella aerogenes]EMC9823471.1 hypothetical protein [Klebsiella aerogenes]HEO1675004.1 hypothetical protein [Klebsiella aerogenes]
MKRVLLIACIVFSIAAAILVIELHVREENDDGFSCIANYIQHTKGFRIEMMISYTFGVKKGIINLSGIATDETGKEWSLDRQVIFQYHREKNIYFLTSVRTTRFSDDNEDTSILSRYIPSFYLEDSNKIVLKILPDGGSNYLFFLEPIPIYNCKRSL